MGMMEPVQKKRTTDVPQGELNFTDKAVMFRFGCGGELPVECFHEEAVDDHERINMRREEEGYFLEVDEFSSDVMEKEEHVEDVCQKLAEELCAVQDRRRMLERAADRILAADAHSSMSTDATPGQVADADYRTSQYKFVKPRRSVLQYAMAEIKKTGRYSIKAVPVNA